MTQPTRSADMDRLATANTDGLTDEGRRHFDHAAKCAGIMHDLFYTVEHRDGIPWNEAPLPPRKHRHTVWTSEWYGLSQLVHCPCGAVMENIRREWSNENARQPTTRRRAWREMSYATASLLGHGVGLVVATILGSLLVLALSYLTEWSTGATTLAAMAIGGGIFIALIPAIYAWTDQFHPDHPDWNSDWITR